MPLVAKSELSAKLGITTTELVRLQNSAGLPVAVAGGPGRPFKYDLEICIQWYEKWLEQQKQDATSQGSTDPLDQARLRKLEIEIEQRIFELEKTRGKYIPITEVLPIVERVFSNIRASLAAIPGSISSQFVGCTDRFEAETLLVDALNKTIIHLNSEATNELVAQQNAKRA